MTALLTLWLPILLSAVVVFAISSAVHMVFKWHAPDYRGFAYEDAVREAIRAGNPTPGRYVVPYCGDMRAMGSEAMQKKYREGPIANLTLAPRSCAPALRAQPRENRMAPAWSWSGTTSKPQVTPEHHLRQAFPPCLAE